MCHRECIDYSYYIGQTMCVPCIAQTHQTSTDTETCKLHTCTDTAGFYDVLKRPHLQEPRELRVSVRNVTTWLAIHQGTDHIPQRTQGQVDLGGFLQPVPGGPRLALPFAPSQIHQVQLPHPDRGPATTGGCRTIAAAAAQAGSGGYLVGRFHCDGEDRVGAGGVLVHAGGPYAAVLAPHLNPTGM